MKRKKEETVNKVLSQHYSVELSVKCNLSSSSCREEKHKVVQMIKKLYGGSFNKHT